MVWSEKLGSFITSGRIMYRCLYCRDVIHWELGMSTGVKVLSMLLGLAYTLAFLSCSTDSRITDEVQLHPVTSPCAGVDGAVLVSAPEGLAPSKADIKAPSGVVKYRGGIDYEKGISAARVSPGDGIFLNFTPQGDTAGGVSFCVYSFNLDGLDQVEFAADWFYKGELTGTYACYLGFLDFTERRWEWFEYDFINPLRFYDAGKYQSEDGLCLVACILAGTQELMLHNMCFTSADLYDEIEPNDTEWLAQLLPPVPVCGFRGSLGVGPPYGIGYDGGICDVFEINAADGDLLTIGILPLYELRSGLDHILSVTNEAGEVYIGTMNRGGITQIPAFSYDTELAPYFLKMESKMVEYEIYIVRGEIGELPVPDLMVSPDRGEAPLVVTLDASASYDPNPGGGIVRYDWDFDGDGLFDDGGSESIVEHTYHTNGVFYPRVRVVTAAGFGYHESLYAWSPGRATVTVGPSTYDEVEDNDLAYPGQYNVLPELPFSGFTGNIGSYLELEGPVYDGDHFDYLMFHAESGVTYSFINDNYLDYYRPEIPPNCILHINDLDGGLVASVMCDGQCISFTPSITADYLLGISPSANFRPHVYSIRGLNNSPPTSVQINSDVSFGLIPLTVNLQAVAYDPEGDELSYSWSTLKKYHPEPELGSESTLALEITDPGRNYVYCQVTDSNGLRKVGEVAIICFTEPYHEIEPNEHINEATPLPPLPFTGVRGSLAGGNYDGYDGSLQDFYSIGEEIEVGTVCEVSVQATPVDQPFRVELLHDVSGTIAGGEVTDGTLTFQYEVVEGFHTRPCYIEVLTGTQNHYLPNIEYEISMRLLDTE